MGNGGIRACYQLLGDNVLVIGKLAFAALSQTATIRSLVCSREMPYVSRP